ncbi:MAG: glycosyltransferase family 4 protein [Bacteroidales bacterium]|nr:glycosyltransferase family 4 protein [Bacteroidales bacterium]
MKKPAAIVSVTNDLTTDQRVNRTCATLVKFGFKVLLVGRRLPNSAKLQPRSYKMHRMRLLFDKGPLFYSEYNIVLFLYLIRHRANLLVSNDLDSLPANYLAYRIKRLFFRSSKNSNTTNNKLKGISHLHDCHEYFRGVPELAGRKKVILIWKWLEDLFFPRLKSVIAVNQSVADLYHKEYGIPVSVMRNVPFRKQLNGTMDKKALNISPTQKVIFYQGAVNIGRGLEEAILALKYMKTLGILVIAGIGDIYDESQQLVAQEGLSAKVIFLGQVPFQELHVYTKIADLGLSIEKDICINYHFCLPNKFFDYIQANVPCLVSPLPVIKSIVDQYKIGEFIYSYNPLKLARQLDTILNDSKKLAYYRRNLQRAAKELCWEWEEKVLMGLLNT